tara:strand:+ start:2325 stop:2972 length:648 start_codon:yes stop_codon:yes gene_type:complete
MSKSRRRKKFEKFSTGAMKNAIRIHMDSILLFDNESYPSSYHLSVLALEEIAKSDWIDHYVETTTTNHGLPEPDGKDEQEWIKLLYIHRRKHFAFINQQFHFLSRDFYDFADSAKLELKKQKAIYVGLERSKKGIDTKSKISKPISQIKLNDAKKIISLNNQVLMNQCIRNIQNGFYYGPEEKYEILNQDLLIELEEKWKFKSRIIESLKIKKSR